MSSKTGQRGSRSSYRRMDNPPPSDLIRKAKKKAVAKTNGPKSAKDVDNLGFEGNEAVRIGSKPNMIAGSLLGFDCKVVNKRKDEGCPKPAEHPENLLGFYGNIAVMVGTKLNKIPGNLLGFDGKIAILVGDKGCPEPAKDPHNLLGFDGNVAVMVGTKLELVPYKRNYYT